MRELETAECDCCKRQRGKDRLRHFHLPVAYRDNGLVLGARWAWICDYCIERAGERRPQSPTEPPP